MSQAKNERVMFFAGEKVTQDFTSPRSLGSTGTGSTQKRDLTTTGKSTFKRTMDTMDPVAESQEVKKKEPSPIRNFQNERKDLGENFIHLLLVIKGSLQQLTQPFEISENIKGVDSIRQLIRMSFLIFGNYSKKPETQTKEQSQKQRDAQLLTNQNEADVLYTLIERTEDIKREENMKKFILQKANEIKMQKQANQKKKKLTKETQERLYKSPESSIRKEKSAPEQLKDKESREFVQRLTSHYKINKPHDKGYANPALLLEHWRAIPDKSNQKLHVTEDQADEYINHHIDKKLEKVDSMRETKYGYSTENPNELSSFYRKELKEEEKQKSEIEIDDRLVDIMFTTYCERKHKRLEEERKDKEAEELKQKMARELLKTKVLKGDVEKTHINDLAKPKDRLVVGKAIMNMTKMFPDDKILKKILIQEFREKKLAKYPEEYDIHDSEEEAEIRGRDQLKEPYKTAAQEKRKFLTLDDLTRPQRAREKEISEPFYTQLEKFYLETNKKHEKEKDESKEMQRQDRLLDRFILKNVKDFLEMRRKRLEQKVYTLKEFLVRCYKEMKSLHPQATKRRFPHLTYGYSKRLKVNSYPLEFKRYFFFLLRSLARGNKLEQGKKLLPFWAPVSQSSTKHGLDKAMSATHNKKVQELSREVAIKKVESVLDEKKVWDKKVYFEHRLKFLMTFDEAVNCTFYPKTGSNIPKKYKEKILREYPSWGGEMMTTKAGSFNEWVQRMGDNFLKRFPTLYKYGKFQKARFYLRKDQYIKAYKELHEAFNIPSIKKEFESGYDPQKDKASMFSRQNLKLDEKEMPQEDFDDEANKRFLEEVYSMIKFLEFKEKDLKLQINGYKRQLEHENRKARAQTQGQAGVGTVEIRKHDKIRSVIFPFKDDPLGVTKYGAKTDDVAYRVFDLRFEKEVKARRKMLQTIIENLHKQVEKDPEPSAWNPGGSKVIQRTSKRLEMYRKLAKKKYLERVKQKSMELKIKQLHDGDEKLNKKMGLYRKANVYHAKEMYNDAFKAIIKAVEIVKREYEDKEERDSKKAGFWRRKLGLPPGTTVTYEQLLAPEADADTGRSEDDGTRSKLWILAEKTGLLGRKPVDVNSFLNYQIEQTYKKIEKSLRNKAKDVEILRKTLERLENEEPEENADPFEIERKINGLNQAIEIRQKKIAEGKPPIGWNPNGAQEAILRIEDYDSLVLRKQIMKNPEKAKKKMEKSDPLQSKFFDKDIDELSRMPIDRN